MAEREPPVVDEHGDFIFRFSLDELPEGEPVYEDALTEMVREQLEALLEVVEVTKGGEPVAIDGFRFLNNPAALYRIFPEEGSAGSA